MTNENTTEDTPDYGNPGGMSPDNWLQIRTTQDEITRWASSQFPHRTDFHALYKLVMEEIPELITHKKEHGTEGIGTELADCFILLLDLASLWEVDVADAIRDKMCINYARTWDLDPATGVAQHRRPAPGTAQVVWPTIDHTKAEEQRRAAERKPPTVICPGCQSKNVKRIDNPTFTHECLNPTCGLLFDDDIPF